MVANSKKAPTLKLTRKELFLALAKDVPDPAGGEKTVPNPYKTWKDINSALPDVKIEVLGPPPTSGTRDAFVELAMEPGAEEFEWVKALSKSDKKKFQAISQTVREDGAYIEAGENDNLIVQKLECQFQCPGDLRLQFSGSEFGQNSWILCRRRRADFRQHRLRKIPGVAAALFLC